MGCVGRAVLVDRVVGIAVVGNDDCLVVVCLCCLDDVLHAVVNCPNGLGDGVIYTGVSHHITISEIHHDEVILLGVDGTHEFLLHLVSRHLGLEVVGGNLRRGHEDAVFVLVRSLASAVEEECHVGILLGLGCVELLESLGADILAKGIGDVLLGEDDVHALERCVVGSHAVVLESGDGLHSLLGHVLLSEHLSELLGAVVAEVDEDNHVALLDGSVNLGIVDRLDELVGNAFLVAFLHSLHHALGLLSLALYEQVVSLFHTVPTLVAVHGIETSHDGSDVSIVLLTHLRELLDKADAALRVGVASVHETVDESLCQTILLAYLHEFEQVVERRVNTTVRCKSHEVKALACFLGVAVCSLYFWILQNRAVLASAVDFHQVLVNYSSCSNVEVSYFGVTHLSVGQTNVFS